MLLPKNSSSNPCCNQTPCEATQSVSAATPSILFLINDELGRYSGNNTMYQRKYYPHQHHPSLRDRKTHLAGANLVKRNKRKRLCQHGRRQVLFRHDKRDQDTREYQLRQKRNRLDSEPRLRRKRRGQIQQRIVRAEIMSMVDPADMMQIRMHQEFIAVPIRISPSPSYCCPSVLTSTTSKHSTPQIHPPQQPQTSPSSTSPASRNPSTRVHSPRTQTGKS